MDTFVFLGVVWIGLTLMFIRKLSVGKLEKKDLVWVIPTAIAGTIYSLDYAVNHWPHITVPVTQGNATNTRYITIVLPRLFPALPFAATIVLGAIVFGGVAILIGQELFGQDTGETTVIGEPIQMESTDGTIGAWEKLQYKNKVKLDVVQIEADAKKADRSINIKFDSWNRNIDHARKPFLIDDPKLYKALEALSDAVNERNDYRYGKRFTEDNRKCLKRCEELRKLHFID